MPELLFDAQKFLQSLAYDEELASELLAAFKEDSPKRRDSLGQALEAGNIERVSKLAHSLKGMCGVVRAQPLVELALNMEHLAKNGDLEKVQEQYAIFVEKLTLAHLEMEQFPG